MDQEPSWAGAKQAIGRDPSRAEAQLNACFEAMEKLTASASGLREHLEHVRCVRPQPPDGDRVVRAEIEEVASAFVDRLRQLERAINAEAWRLNELRAELEV